MMKWWEFLIVIVIAALSGSITRVSLMYLGIEATRTKVVHCEYTVDAHANPRKVCETSIDKEDK